MTQITRADVIGKSQNRTALGMIAAYLAKYPNTTLSELRKKFPKSAVCPDAGTNLEELFFTAKDIENKKQAGDNWFIKDGACFTKDDEWLTLANGEKIAFCKMWTASSLALLQDAMKPYNIYGQVGTPQGGTAGYAITYQYAPKAEPSQPATKSGMPAWIWIVLAVVVVAGFFVFK
ncbi:hypothetical protein B0181_02680 [Moraxella caviae]|uniref:Uncharacterized protein n=1 Tax=Moraxella caviae TaxID=34060 RepID=A0A1T0A7S1_9GAMM|nr:hypothetical protein [Moraxella caviae]OOR91669.1 hypothetical protein B0181_02680 [Moraxella caviae]STZ10413.1 Uncharacterised protein [Moraxella caviae]